MQTLIRTGEATSSTESCLSGFPYYGHEAVFPSPTAPLSCSTAIQSVWCAEGEGGDPKLVFSKGS